MGDQIGRRRRKRHVWPVVLLAAVLAVLLAGTTLMLALRAPRSGSSGSAAPVSGDVPQRTLPQAFIDRNTASKYILLRDVTAGRDLYSKAADVRCYPASLTKLMTALVAMDHLAADTVVTVGQEVRLIDPESSRAYLTPGTQLTAEQLLQALLLPSGNDAAYTIAAHVGRLVAGDSGLSDKAAIARFCNAMNDKAAALGCTGTQFKNPDGIHDPGHYTTAADMMRIAEQALAQETIARTVALPSVTTRLVSGQTVTWKNTNKLVRESGAYAYDGATGLKTGATDEAGHCLVASATRDGHTSVVVLMGGESESGRWDDACGLLDISFQ